MSVGVEPRAIERGHEPDTTSVRWIVLATVALFVGIGVAMGLLWHLRPSLSAEVEAYELGPARAAPPPDFEYARHWVRRLDLRASRAEKARRLRSYGWVDAQAGVVHLPVERAAELLLAEGLEVAPPPPEEGGR